VSCQEASHLREFPGLLFWHVDAIARSQQQSSDWKTNIKVSARNHSVLLSLCVGLCHLNVCAPFLKDCLNHEAIRTIRFEPKMDVPDIWQRKNRITVMLIHHNGHCMMLSSKKRVFAIILAPTHYSQFWRSLLSADHSSRPKRAQEHE
jgi:hypothetical protein